MVSTPTLSGLFRFRWQCDETLDLTLCAWQCDEPFPCDHFYAVCWIRSAFSVTRHVSCLAEASTRVRMDHVEKFALGLVESYGYGWYVALIWTPLYNVFASRSKVGGQ